MIKDNNYLYDLSKALLHAEVESAILIIEKFNLHPIQIINDEEGENILLAAINSLSEHHGSQSQIELISYLIQHGANPNLKSKAGYNSLHLALEYHKLSKIALKLILNTNVDVNSADSNGNSPIFTAIREYGKTWREDQKEVNGLRFKIIEELMNRGADLNQNNNFGINARRWIKSANDEKLDKLIANY